MSSGSLVLFEKLDCVFSSMPGTCVNATVAPSAEKWTPTAHPIPESPPVTSTISYPAKIKVYPRTTFIWVKSPASKAKRKIQQSIHIPTN
ncbi:unnamed protein product [Sphagnum jensenii]|uniref:Uncharacterized protein n=1 Tax=Sphagnum jensenii TaxID=128206 RepID=A0ABP1BDQ7_9BRYO